jgi:CRP-like cAMP-binding protein
VLSEDGRSANAETLAESRLLVLDRDGFMALLNKNPSISLQIIHTLIDRLALADRQIKNLALGNSRAKIADILIQLSQDFSDEGSEKGKSKKVNVRLTHQELADLAGLARETTTKLLNEFVKDEAIQLADREIEIMDPDKLSKWTM